MPPCAEIPKNRSDHFFGKWLRQSSLCTMGTDPAWISAERMIHAQTLVRYVLPVRSRKAKAAPKLRFAEPQKCRVKCSLVRHGLRYIFFHHPLVFLNLHATARPPQPIKPLRANYTILRRLAANPIHIQSHSTHAEWRSRGEVSQGLSPQEIEGSCLSIQGK